MLLAIILLLASGYLSYRNLSSIVTSIRIDFKPELTLVHIREISMDLEKAGNSIRIFMITNDTADLHPYYSVISNIDENLGNLRLEVLNYPGLPDQVDTIGKLIEENIFIWNELLYLKQNDRVNEYLKQLSDKLNALSDDDQKGILKRVFSRGTQTGIDRQGLIDDLQKIEQQDRITQQKMMSREQQMAITGSRIKEQFYDLITIMENEISGLIETKAEDAGLLARKTYWWLAMFSLSGTLLAILVLFIISRYVRKTYAYQAALENSKDEAEKLAQIGRAHV